MTAVRPAAPPETRPNWVRALYERRRWLWVVPVVPAAVVALLVMVVLPPDQTLDNLGEFVLKLVPFGCAVAAVALMPRWKAAPWLFLLAVFVYMGYLDTELVLRIQEYGRTALTDEGTFAPIYQFELFITTFIVLFALMAYRLGGARTANVLKTGLAAILVVISGLNDLTFWAVNDVWAAGEKPEALHWASHMIVFTGGPPSVPTAVVFMVIHLVLAGVVAALPLGKWVDRKLAA
ncbi:hypothetical protein L6E12_07650 [Actinokineospora sp. PR83]|uniref:hypothetical protein n=1 Tax=Actinokineospora sp. PR83 TaxID=2884908 RepID=UPI0027E1DFA2|nr:hypothetical protein [Actinokineospora sp. PR83]MCG8915658.1 hypothetical protein [Actinokineospora sp. PR83]